MQLTPHPCQLHLTLSICTSSDAYRISRNPAFVGFDLMYIGLLMAFPNIIHLLFAVFPAVMLHLQIGQEEDFLRKTFGTEYEEYCRKVSRYF